MHLYSDFSMRLTDSIDDTVHEVWEKGKLEDAEELLSRQTIGRVDTDHSVLAKRALIQARLHEWDTALKYAETVCLVFLLNGVTVISFHEQSIDIQPSVIAHVARGFALFGKKEYASAVEAFNDAFRECNMSERALVSLAKVSHPSVRVTFAYHPYEFSPLYCLRSDIMSRAWLISLI